MILLIVTLLSGCGKGEKPDSARDETVDITLPKQEAALSDFDVIGDNLGSQNVDVALADRLVPADLFSSGSYLESSASFDEFVENIYVDLVGAEFIRASQELIYSRRVLADNRELSSWLLASSIEDVLSRVVLTKAEEGSISASDAKTLIEAYQERFYSIDSIASVFDDEFDLKRDERFTETERCLLKDKVRLKDLSSATEQHRYRALTEHITAVTGGLREQIKIDWAGDMYALVALSKLYEAHKQTAMGLVYIDHLNRGGDPLNENNVEVFKNEISDSLSSVDLPEFAAFGFGRITASELVRFIQKL